MNWNELLSGDRIRSFQKSTTTRDLRTEFEKDYHRIIGSASFRRLQDKTQVFPLDKSDYIRTRLTHSLEVSSCGLERHLREEKHYKMAIGKEIAITLYKAIDGNREIEALLKDVSKNKIVIKAEEKELEIEMSDIASAKILFKWEEWGKWIRNFLKR